MATKEFLTKWQVPWFFLELSIYSSLRGAKALKLTFLF